MKSSFLFFLILLFPFENCLCQNGPGRGEWQVRTPESQGLSSAELDAAADATYESIPGRVCYLVIKNGFIVKEEYYDGWNSSRMREGYSTTKSHCSSLYGIARQQGWANTSDLVRNRNEDTRECNPDATFKLVLQMAAEGEDMNNPTFFYDGNGVSCLDVLSDFIQQNNPEGLTTYEFAQRYWSEKLGMENFEWENNNGGPNGYLPCGIGSRTSCRDLGRAAQLWVNEGVWVGEQIIARNHILEGRQFPDYNPEVPYGYNVWLDPWAFQQPDDVDPEVHAFIGVDDQTAIISKAHEAIIVSMGGGASFGILSWTAWANTKYAIVSNNATLS